MRVMYKSKLGTWYLITAIGASMDSRGLKIQETESKFYIFSMPSEAMEDAMNSLCEKGYANLRDFSPS